MKSMPALPTIIVRRIGQHIAPFFGAPQAADQVSLRSRDALLLVAAVAIWYIVSYLSHPAAPTLQVTFSGWLGWFDQGEYHKAAHDLAALHLRPSHYWYGYPLLGAPFVPFIPQHPFFIPNLVLVCGTMLCFHAACRTLVSRGEAWFLALAAFLVDPALWTDSLVVPWNSIPVYFALFSTAWLTLFRGDRPCHWYLAAGAIALATSCRPPDLPILLVVYYTGLFLRPQRQGWWRLAVAPIAGTALVLALQLGATYVVHGSFVSPYVAANTAVGFSLSRIPVKLYQWLVDPMLLTGADSFLPPGTSPQGVIERLPHVLLILPGIAMVAQRKGLRTLGLPLAVAPALAIYLGFNAASYPAHYWTYKGYHHIWWFTPWLALWGWLTISRAWRELRVRTSIFLVLSPVVAVSIFSFRASVSSKAEIIRDPPVGVMATTTATVVRTTSNGLRFESLLPSGAPVDAVRIRGRPALPFHASVAGSHFDFTVRYDDRELRGFADYFPVGSPEELVLSFLPSPLRNAQEKLLVVDIRRAGLESSQPQSLEYLSVDWRPGTNLKHWYSLLNPTPRPWLSPSDAPGLASAVLLSGWSTGGPGYVWSVGKRAKLRLPAERGRQVVALEFVSGSFVAQELTVKLDGRIVGKVGVLDRQAHRIDLGTKQPGEGPHEISFDISTPTSPQSIGMNSDERMLGVELWSIDFVYLP